MEELETAAKCTPSMENHNRMMAIKALILGFDFEQVMALFGKTRRTLTRWIMAFNNDGIDGLIERQRTGRALLLDPSTVAHCKELIEEPAKAGVTHWTAKKFHGYLCETMGRQVSYSTVVRMFHRENFALKIPQPWPDRQDSIARKLFVENINQWLNDQNIEIWFTDESGFEGDPRPRRRWAKKGVKARVAKNGSHIRMNVTGMVCPRTGEVFFLEFSHSNTETFQAFLDEANTSVNLKERVRQILILDNASWHKAKRLDFGRFEPMYLPAYSPDLNPIERLWAVIKSEWFVDFTAHSHDDLIARLDLALQWATRRGEANSKTCSVKTSV